MEWYFIQDGEQVGPFTDEEFAQHVSDGTITADTLVWNETMDDWCRQDELSASPPSQPDEAQPRNGVCGECGNTFPNDDMIVIAGVSVCAACKPIALQKVREGVDLPNVMNYAGFWVRFAAKFIDGIILGVLNAATGVIFTGVAAVMGGKDAPLIMIGASMLNMLLNLLVGAAYTTYFLGSRGATLGKMACGLRVVMADGTKISYGRAFGRHFAEMLSAITLMIGYIIAAFDSEKRALHDHICGTRVITK